MGEDFEREMAAFHAAARRRKAWIFAIAAVFCIATGVIALAVAIAAGGDESVTRYHGRRYEFRTIAVGVVLVIVGFACALTSYRIGSGKILDVDESNDPFKSHRR